MEPGAEPGTEQAVYAYLVVGSLGFSLQMKKGRSRDLPKVTRLGGALPVLGVLTHA